MKIGKVALISLLIFTSAFIMGYITLNRDYTAYLAIFNIRHGIEENLRQLAQVEETFSLLEANLTNTENQINEKINLALQRLFNIQINDKYRRDISASLLKAIPRIKTLSLSSLINNLNVYKENTLRFKPPELNIVMSNIYSLIEPASSSLITITMLALLKRAKNLKRHLKMPLLIATLIMIFTSGFFIGRLSAQTTEPNLYFEAYQLPYSYKIYTDGTYYYAVRYDGALTYGGASNRGGVDGRNATQVIQAVLNTLTEGGLVILSEGRYVVKSLQIKSSNIIITGMGNTIIEFPSNINDETLSLINASRVENIVISNIQISGDMTTRPTFTTTSGIEFRDVNNSIIYNVLFDENLINIDDKHLIHINMMDSHNNMIINVENALINLDASSNNLITGCYLYSICIFFSSNSNIIINNKIKLVKYPTADTPLYICDCNNNIIVGNVIEGVLEPDGVSEIVVFSSLHECINNAIISNYIKWASLTLSNVKNTVVLGNTIENNNIPVEDTYSIWVDYSESVIIASNTIMSDKYRSNGITIVDSCGIMVLGCSIIAQEPPSEEEFVVCDAGIYINIYEQYYPSVIVANNYIVGSFSGVAIEFVNDIYYGVDFQIIGNRIGENWYGVYCDAPNVIESGCTIVGNYFYNNLLAGIEIYGANNLIVGNQFASIIHVENTFQEQGNIIVANEIKGGEIIVAGANFLIANNKISYCSNGINSSVLHNGVIVNNIISKSIFYGINIESHNVSSLLISGNVFVENGEAAIYIYNPQSGYMPVHGIITNNMICNGVYGIRIVGCSKLTIADNIIAENSGDYGIDIRKCMDITLAGNNIERNGGYGISIMECAYITVADNIITAHDFHNVYVNNSENIIIKGNVIRNSLENGIAISYSDGITIENNIITDNGDNGILIGDGVHFVVISGNKISNNGFDGISINDRNSLSYGVVITNNIISENANIGIFIWCSFDVTIEGNYIYQNEWMGIGVSVNVALIPHVNELVICSNYISLHNVGIWLDGTVYSVISNNRINDNDIGIMLLYSSDNTISGNAILYSEYALILSSSSQNNVQTNTARECSYIQIDADSQYNIVTNNDLLGVTIIDDSETTIYEPGNRLGG